MKSRIFWLITTLLTSVCSVQADEVWDSGHYIMDGEVYFEISMYNDATADILSGEAYKLEMFNNTSADIFGGTIDVVLIWDNSNINIMGGQFQRLGSYDNSEIFLHAYDVTYHPTGGGNHGDMPWIEGIYISDDSHFSCDLWGQDVYSHINVVPEPSGLLLFFIGGIFAKRRLNKNFC